MAQGLASLRNILRLSQLTSEGNTSKINQAIETSKSKLEAQRQQDIGEVCCPLPFPLQDLCLLVVVSDLDCYPTELLALLPRWLRHRLLSVLPALDLGRLEHTPVAAGVDVNEIWESRYKPDSKKPLSHLITSTQESMFQLKVSTTYQQLLEPTIKEHFDEFQLAHGQKRLLTAVSEVLSNTRSSNDVSRAIHQLISIRGDLLFSNLLAGSMHQSECSTSQCGHKVWLKQATSLAVNMDDPHLLQVTSYVPVYRLEMHEWTYLTPHRLLPIMYDQDPTHLLSLLTQGCSLQPSTALLCINSISHPLLVDLRCERLLLDSGVSLASNDLSLTFMFNRLLEKVALLCLQFNSYSDIGLFTGMVNAVMAGGESCQLKYFYCSIPNLYMDLLQPLSDLFSLKNFHELLLDISDSDLNLLGFSKLLQAFMAAPCSHTQKLMLKIKRSPYLTSFKEDQLAILGKGDTQLPLPSCNARQKVLECSTDEEFTKVLYLLLQLPRIRLKEIIINNNHEFLHLCPLHPDLEVTKIVLYLFNMFSSKQKERIQADLVATIGMPCLQKVVFSGNWGKDEEIKSGIVQGLRSRTTTSPLRKISLELAAKESYKKGEFQALFDAIFSLPKLENLKLVLGKGFADMIQQPGFEDTLYQSWHCRASDVRVKRIRLLVDQTYKSKFEQLSLVAQELSFSAKQTRSSYYTSKAVYGLFGNDYPAGLGYYQSWSDESGHYFDSDDSYGYYYDSDDY